jgi:hypothetical protein
LKFGERRCLPFRLRGFHADLADIIISLITVIGTISRFVGAAQKAWLKAIDARIKLLVRILFPSLSFAHPA